MKIQYKNSNEVVFRESTPTTEKLSERDKDRDKDSSIMRELEAEETRSPNFIRQKSNEKFKEKLDSLELDPVPFKKGNKFHVISMLNNNKKGKIIFENTLLDSALGTLHSKEFNNKDSSNKENNKKSLKISQKTFKDKINLNLNTNKPENVNNNIPSDVHLTTDKINMNFLSGENTNNTNHTIAKVTPMNVFEITKRDKFDRLKIIKDRINNKKNKRKLDSKKPEEIISIKNYNSITNINSNNSNNSKTNNLINIQNQQNGFQ